MNCRALYKMSGTEYTMVQMKRLLAYGFAAKSVRVERMQRKINEVECNGVFIEVRNEKSRLDGKTHFVGSSGRKRLSCKVHKSSRCITNKTCITCGNVGLCGPEAWVRWHSVFYYAL